MMNEPIGLTLADLFNVLLALCGAIITVSAAVGIIVNFINRAKLPNKQQNERIDALEKEVKSIKEKIVEVDERHNSTNARIDKVDNELRDITRVIIEGLQALTSHAIDGNNTEQLRIAKERLDNYLLSKV